MGIEKERGRGRTEPEKRTAVEERAAAEEEARTIAAEIAAVEQQLAGLEQECFTRQQAEPMPAPVRLVSLSEVEEKEPEWLVWQYIPKGQINLLAGDGGSGKTTSWCGLAAAVSKGTRAFFEAEGPNENPFAGREPQKVMFFSSEDSLEYTLKARLRKAGANLDNIYSASLRDERFAQIKFNSPACWYVPRSERLSHILLPGRSADSDMPAWHSAAPSEFPAG